MEILDLRHFSSADLRLLLEEESRDWARLLSWDYSSSIEMVLRYIDAKILPGYAAVERGRVVGYAFFVYEGSKGVIGDLYVSSTNGARSAAAHDTENRLLTHVIETLQQSPGIHRAEAQLLVHETGRISQPFQHAGFQRYPRLFMLQDLRPARESRPLHSPLQIRTWQDSDYQSAASLITACYRGHIDSEINDQYRTLSGSLRFLNNIVRFPGCGTFDAQSSFVALNPLLKSTVGVILCSRIRQDVGHITQICVLPEYRTQGIGDALMNHSCEVLRSQGFSMMSLTVTQANSSAVHLYERLGFRTHRIFDAFVWEG